MVVLSIEVTDTGIGMSPATQAAIFEPFTQADYGSRRSFGGTGLGLCISAQLAKLMGCPQISLHSTEGRGSAFRVDLVLDVADGDSDDEGGDDDDIVGVDDDSALLF